MQDDGADALTLIICAVSPIMGLYSPGKTNRITILFEHAVRSEAFFVQKTNEPFPGGGVVSFFFEQDEKLKVEIIIINMALTNGFMILKFND